MTGKTRSSFPSIALIVVLFFAALSPTVAYADDGSPPDTPPTEVTTACTADGECPSSEETTPPTSEAAEVIADVITDEISTPVEATAEPTSAAPEATSEATTPPDEAPADAGGEGTSSGEAAPVAEQATSTLDPNILGEVPNETAIIVVDATGQSEPLAAQSAAEAIATSDPIWCPAAVTTPTPGANGCTDSFTSFDGLLTFLSGNATYQGAGIIYVQQGAYLGGESVIDFNSAAYNLSNIRNSDLTVTGGWNTSNNTIDPTAPSSFTVPIIIGSSTNPWGGTLFLSNLTINNTDGTGLTLHAQNEILLVNVDVTNSTNGAGAELNAGGDVSIADSKFERNKAAGAIIRSASDVLILNSSFSNPATARRQITGLDILNNGSVALIDSLVNENRQVGANINSGGRVTVTNSFFSGTKATNGTGAATTFLGYGLQVVTPDAIDLVGVTANDNFLWGASLDNCMANSAGICTGSGDVTIADSIFNANTTESPGFIDDTGLLITSNGNVALQNVQADENRLIGAVIKTTGNVAINESSFSRNKGQTISSTGATTFHGYGLQVTTDGNIAITQVNASDNTLFGARLEAGGDITVADSNFNNQTSGSATDQTGRGLEAVSGGSIFLSNIFVDNNQTFGADLQAGNDVSLSSVTATNNGLDGVDVETSCNTVTLAGGNYSNNGGYGLSVINSALDADGSTVFANNGAGNLFQDPGSCVFTVTPPTTGNGNVTGPNTGTGLPAFVPVQSVAQPSTSMSETSARGGSPSGTGMSALTLNRFVGNLRTLNGDNQLSIFIGQYTYLDTDAGIQIFAFSPASEIRAVGES